MDMETGIETSASLPELPTEIWTIIFEQLDFPTSMTVVRRGRVQQLQQTIFYEPRRTGMLPNLPAFERSKWFQIRQFYNISKSTREAARRAKLAERWCGSLQDVIRADRMFSPQVRSIQRIENGPPEVIRNASGRIHGRRTPEYLAVQLFAHPWSASSQVSQDMIRSIDRFARFVHKHPAFSTLRRIDIIATVRQTSLEKARENVGRLLEEHRTNPEWKRRNVLDGVVRTWWEVVPDINEATIGELGEVARQLSFSLSADALK